MAAGTNVLAGGSVRRTVSEIHVRSMSMLMALRTLAACASVMPSNIGLLTLKQRKYVPRLSAT